MNVTLTKLKSSHDRLRGGSISGWCSGYPVEGRSFRIVAGDKDREVVTSVVTGVVQVAVDSYVVLTQNSTYLLQEWPEE